jgi:hypothetical protein
MQRGHNTDKARKEHQEVPSLAYRESGRVHRCFLAKLPSDQLPHTALTTRSSTCASASAIGCTCSVLLVVCTMLIGVRRAWSHVWPSWQICCPRGNTRRKHVKHAKELAFRQSQARRCVGQRATFTTGTKTLFSTKTHSTVSV